MNDDGKISVRYASMSISRNSVCHGVQIKRVKITEDAKIMNSSYEFLQKDLIYDFFNR